MNEEKEFWTKTCGFCDFVPALFFLSFRFIPFVWRHKQTIAIIFAFNYGQHFCRSLYTLCGALFGPFEYNGTARLQSSVSFAFVNETTNQVAEWVSMNVNAPKLPWDDVKNELILFIKGAVFCTSVSDVNWTQNKKLAQIAWIDLIENLNGLQIRRGLKWYYLSFRTPFDW